MKKLIFTFVLFTALNSQAALPLDLTPSLQNLRNECQRTEEDFPDFACLKFEFFQSSPERIEEDLQALIEMNEYNLQRTSSSEMLRLLMASMDAQIYRYQKKEHVEALRRLKAKNHWELLKAKKDLDRFMWDPHTYWYPSVNAMSFIAINQSRSVIAVISHGERN
ncbi:hypothetical protein AZI87_04585 [Bdellovibrio bacteriovorus]|uniref:Uncharacterized protein n=1 Tax=Bdellovibrio bacteriovorus TaxID=959 RepID=A0A162GMU4_BDEBC|nr:hypothetical protein [Bdellovibrio bacteriovorus]KYG68525.1 hypothetical protein AZI87_04585 [Bdellovibrio bacteriovorus]